VADTHHDIEAEIPRLRRYARALTRDVVSADDLVQDCLTRALGKLHLWQEGTDLRAWLFTILHNQYVNRIRRAVREGATVALNETEPMLSRAPQQGKRLELRDLERAIAQLPEEQRTVILLVGLEGMRYEEVAAVLDVPVGTIRSRLSRGREALRRLTGAVPEEKAETVISESKASRPPASTFARTRPAVASRDQHRTPAAAAAPQHCQGGAHRKAGRTFREATI
jgi:RNA polymerase sigma-70 factor (ECF subfamily)